MNLVDDVGASMRLTFPDLSGESYRRMWEERECDASLTALLTAGAGVLLFIHADQIQPPQWLVDNATLTSRMGLTVEAGKEEAWHPRLAPTQVQVVELLQFLFAPPLDIGPRRVAVLLSAWDKVVPEGRAPAAYLAERMPLLHQYLAANAARCTCRVYGVSAQGGEYEAGAQTGAAEALRKLNRPSERILLASDGPDSHDLTEPVAWLAK
jgi:hypothetical protein